MSFLQAVVAKTQKISHHTQFAGQHVLHSGMQLVGLASRAYDAPNLQGISGSWDHRPTPVATNQSYIFKNTLYIYISHFMMLYYVILYYYIVFHYYIYIIIRYIYMINIVLTITYIIWA